MQGHMIFKRKRFILFLEIVDSETGVTTEVQDFIARTKKI